MRGIQLTAVALSMALALSACAGENGSSKDDPITIGVLTSLSGPLSSFGKTWLPAFEAGLEYATDGSMDVDGRPIKVKKVDDQSDQAAAISGATELASDGVKIIAGTMSSGAVASLADFAETNSILYMTGAANTDAATGANELTFRGSRQSYQDVLALSSLLGEDARGKRLCMLAHDIEYGNTLVKVTTSVLKDKVGEFKTISVPFPTTDVSPYVLQVKSSDCGVLVPFLAGSVSDFWQAFAQQGIADDTLIVSNIGTRADWPAYASAQTDNVRLFTSYFDGAADNEAATAMREALKKAGADLDYASADGFGAAIALVEGAKKAGGDDPEALAKALDGLVFDGPRGATTIRSGDHALLAPMFAFHFEGAKPTLDKEIPVDELKPKQN